VEFDVAERAVNTPTIRSEQTPARGRSRAWLYTLLIFLGVSFAFSAFVSHALIADGVDMFEFCDVTKDHSGHIILDQGDPEANTGMLSCHLKWWRAAMLVLYFVVLLSPITAVFTYGTWRRTRSISTRDRGNAETDRLTS